MGTQLKENWEKELWQMSQEEDVKRGKYSMLWQESYEGELFS